MEKQYDEEYKAVIKQLNEAFYETPGETYKNKRMAEPLVINKSRHKRNISEDEIKIIKSRLKQGIQKIEYIDENSFISDIYRNLSCKILTWKLTGSIDTKEIMASYTKFIKSNDVYHSVYLCNEKAAVVKVVYGAENMTFPVQDFRTVKKERIPLLLQGIVAAEKRRIFRIEVDYPLNLKGFITSDDEMIVVVSIYPYFMYPVGVREMMLRIFENMKLENINTGDIDENILKKMYDQLQEKTLEYWHNELSDSGKMLMIPGEKFKNQETSGTGAGYAAIKKEIPDNLMEEIGNFAQKKRITLKTILIYAWAKLLGRYNSERTPMLLIADILDSLDMVPVKVDLEMAKNDELPELEKRLKDVKRYVNCTRESIEKETNVIFKRQFRLIQDFSDMDSSDTEKKVNENTEINLSIFYNIENRKISMRYVSKSGFYELILENLHDMFLDVLTDVVKEDSGHFDKSTFIKDDDTNEQKLRKIRLAQIALYLKNSGIFSSLSVDDIMKLSEYCTLLSYLQDDEICKECTRENMIYIIGDGKVEESRMNCEGMVNSIRIAKPGNIFGIESLFDGKTYQSTYTVVSGQAKIVGIDGDILKETLRRKPDGWIALLEMENEQKCKAQHLWMMD